MTVIVRELPVIDMTELQVAMAGAPEDAPIVDVGAQADPAPVQALQPPPPARTMTKRIARLKEDVHEIRVALGEQHEVMDAMARNFSRFTVWAARGISQLLDSAGATCVSQYGVFQFMDTAYWSPVQFI
ncbi:hypothetical protein Tco_1550814 [Tanacetum coccineum]